MSTRGGDQRRAFGVCQQERDVLSCSGRGELHRRESEVLNPLEPCRASVGISAHDDLGTAPKRFIRKRFDVANDERGPVAIVEKNVGTGVDADEHRPVGTDVAPKRDQVFAVVVSAHDDEHLFASKLSRDVGHADAIEKQIAVAAQVLHRVRSERLELHSQALACIGHCPLHGLDGLLLPRRDDPVPGIQRTLVKPHDVAITNVGQHAGSDAVEQRNAVRDKNLRARGWGSGR